ncbi:MAG: hypothetical protein ACLQBL_13555 [Polyangiaceae bacterium]
MVRSQMFAVMLGLCALGMGGCAVQTASGDPSSTQTEEGRDPAGTSSSATSSGQVDDPSGGNLNPVHPVSTNGKEPQTESSADAVKAQSTSSTPCTASNTCPNSNSDNSQPLPWVITPVR